MTCNGCDALARLERALSEWKAPETSVLDHLRDAVRAAQRGDAVDKCTPVEVHVTPADLRTAAKE